MPWVDDIIDCLGKAKFLSKLDLNKGFHQVTISEADIKKTAFCTEWGKFEYLFMPFGLRNAPSTFSKAHGHCTFRTTLLCKSVHR